MLGSRKEAKFPIYNFLTTITKFLIMAGWGDGEDKKVILSKDLAKIEKDDVEEVEDGR